MKNLAILPRHLAILPRHLSILPGHLKMDWKRKADPSKKVNVFLTYGGLASRPSFCGFERMNRQQLGIQHLVAFFQVHAQQSLE